MYRNQIYIPKGITCVVYKIFYYMYIIQYFIKAVKGYSIQNFIRKAGFFRNFYSLYSVDKFTLIVYNNSIQSDKN